MDELILVVDDIQTDLDFVEAVLDGSGYQVMKANDGQVGLQRIKEKRPALVVSDILMPGMNGFEFFKEMRRDKTLSQIPVLIMSARPKMADSFLALGVDGFMAKPFHVENFLAEVNKLTKRIVGATVAPQSIQTEEVESGQKNRLDEPSLPKFQQDIPGLKKTMVIFGTDDKTLQDMRQQLEKKGCFVVAIRDEGRLVPTVQEVKPDVVFLALNLATKVPIDNLVYTLNALSPSTKGALEQKNKNAGLPGSKKTRIVLYKFQEEKVGAGDAGSELADFENLLQRCFEGGAAKYIGIYSSYAFLPKVQEFL